LDITQDKRFLEGFGRRGILVAGGVGLAGLLLSFLIGAATDGGMHRLWWAYLHSWVYFASLSLGALFFVMVLHVSRAGWGVLMRRVGEGFAAGIAVMVVLFVPLLFGLGHLYPWIDPGVAAEDYLVAKKISYLNLPFLMVRLVIYFAFWILAAWLFLRTSARQDSTGDPKLSVRLERTSAPFLLLYALTVTFASFDLLMALDARWYSTIFGVYFFSGAVLGWFALMPLAFFVLQSRGILTRSVSAEHYHDIGKFMFGFVVFWAYIAFSQYMLIWYGNLPDETDWYLRRQTGGWAWIGLALVFGHFVIPFLFLLPRAVKRNPGWLTAAGILLLAMHWVDLYYVIMPELDHEASGLPLSVLDLTCWVGIGGVFIAGVLWILGRQSLVPERDPRIDESLGFENA
jgi:hypothetical protein